MILRFGYVSHALSLWDASPAKTLTFSRWKKLDPADREAALKEATRLNLEHTLRMLHFNIAHQIHVYRFSSSLVPLGTHPDVEWDYITPFRHLYEEIGNLVKKHRLRTSFHPNQFTLFTSDQLHVTKNAVIDLTYHYNVLQAMGLEDQSFINIHVGGAYGNKEAAVERFHQNLPQLPAHIKARMTLENDDKTYTGAETLEICQAEQIPLMFDYHHYMANKNEDASLEELLPAIYETWKHQEWRPKVHISSPKNEKEYRSHADYVDPEFLLPFLKAMKAIDHDVDVMIEAKQKDKAALQLVEDLAKIRGIKRIGGASLEW